MIFSGFDAYNGLESSSLLGAHLDVRLILLPMEFSKCYRKILQQGEAKNFVDQKCSKAKNSHDSYVWVHRAIKKSTEHS